MASSSSSGSPRAGQGSDPHEHLAGAAGCCDPRQVTQPTANEEQQTVAVVVVHGIGNQLPMDTVRALVDNVFGDESGLQHPETVYSRLYRDAPYLDLRRLMLTITSQHPRADFFELYWQARFGSGSPAAVLSWVVRLLRSNPTGSQIRQVVKTARIILGILLLVTLGLALGAIAWGPEEGWKSYVTPALPFLVLALALPKLLVNNLLSTVVADASRWFSPGPGDIEGRDTVRQLGVDLLKDLHRTSAGDKPRYGRIIVIGHSLGAVVAYDAIRLAFDDLRDPANDPPVPESAGPPDKRQPSAWNFPHPPPDPATPGTPTPAPADGLAYHQVQARLHTEQRSQGVAWRVTDFITAGTPLTHARDLLSNKHVDLERRMVENELPCCPPLGEQQHHEEEWAKNGDPLPPAAGLDGKGRIAFYRDAEQGPLRAHEASPFATTRWTNLYIPMKWWLGGDPVGGPVAPVFGPGVRDIEVEVSAPRKTKRRVMAVPVKAHTWYWHRDGGSANPEKDCIVRLREAIDLRWP